MIAARTNTYPGNCARCGGWVEAQEGMLGDKVDGRWTVEHRTKCPTGPVYAPTAARAGRRCEVCGASVAHFTHDLSGIGGYACRRCDDGSLSFA